MAAADGIFGTLGVFLDAVRLGLEPVFNLFRDERVAIALALLLIVAAVVLGMQFCLVNWLPWYRNVSQAAKQIEGFPRDPASFFSDYETLSAMMSGRRRLAHAWAEFAETLIVPETPEPIRNTSRPQHYFNMHAATEAGLPLSFYLSLPNVFVGVGLLLTFIGLVSALHFAAQGVTSSNVIEAQHALESLLKAATFKFLTSIAGVFASIALSLVFKRLARQLQLAFDRLNSALEARLYFITAEAIAIEQREELKRQSLQLERFNTDFAVELANALDQRLSATLSAALTQAVQPVVSAVESLSGNLGTQTGDAMRQMIGDFQTGLKHSTGAELQNVVAALGSVRETLDRASAGMGENGAAFGARIEQAAEALETRLGEAVRSMADGVAAATSHMETLVQQSSERTRSDAEAASAAVTLALRGASTAVGKDIEAAGGQLSDDVRRVSEVLASSVQPISETLSALTDTLHTLDGRFNAQIAQFDGAIVRLQGLVGHLERAGEQLRGAGVPIADTAKRFESAGSRVEEGGRAFAETQRRLSDLAATLDRSVVKNNEVWERYSSRFDHADEQLGLVVKGLSEGAEAYQRRIASFVSQVDEKLAATMLQFRAALNDLGDLLEEMGDEHEATSSDATTSARPTISPRTGPRAPNKRQ